MADRPASNERRQGGAPVAPVVLAAGTVGGAGTEVALSAALRAGCPERAVAQVPAGFADEAASAGWVPEVPGRIGALWREAIGRPRAEVWVGFCDRLPLLRGGRSQTMVVQNPHLYGRVDPAWPLAQKLKFAALGAWARASARRADLLVCSTPSSAAEVARATGVDRSRIEVAPIPVVGISATKDAHRPRIERVLLVGDVYPYKQLDVAVEAVQRFARADERKVTLVHLGTARDATAARLLDEAVERARAAGVEVERRGHVSRDEVAAEMVAADVLLLPSTTETQGLPLVEAQAVGLPVAARAIGAFQDLAGDAALLVDVDGGATEFAEALGALDDEAERRGLAQRGRALRPLGGAWDVVELALQAASAAR